MALRAWTLAEERAGNPIFERAVLDDAVYLRLADDVRTGASAGRAWFLAPLYPWFLAFVARDAAPTMQLAQWTSVAVGAAAAATTAFAARIAHSVTAGWIAGLLAAGAGALVFQDVLPGQEPLLCLGSAAALALVAVHVRLDGSATTAALLGVVVGVAMLGRATSAALLLAFAVVAFRGTQSRWRSIAVAAVVAGLVLLPAALRNASAVGDFTPFPWSGGPNFHVANGPLARERVAFVSAELPSNPDLMERRAEEIAALESGRELKPSEISSFWTKRTWDEAPAGALAAHWAKKAALFWDGEEIGNTHDVVVERSWSTWLSLVPSTSRWLLVLGLGGWWLARRRAPALDFAALSVLFTWAALVVFFPVARYRMPMVPLAVAAAGAGAAELLLFGTSLRRAAVAAALVALPFGTSLLHLRVPSHAGAWGNVARAFEEGGDRVRAQETLRRGLADEPEDGRLLEQLGRLQLDAGRPDLALATLERAAKDARTKWSSGVPAVGALVLLGRAADAERAGGALLDKPLDRRSAAELLAYMALAAHVRGDDAVAVERLRRAEAADPGSPAAAEARRRMGR